MDGRWHNGSGVNRLPRQQVGIYLKAYCPMLDQSATEKVVYQGQARASLSPYVLYGTQAWRWVRSGNMWKTARAYLMKRRKVRDRKAALCRFPHCDLYEHYGLYKSPSGGRLASGICLGMKNIGKPCARELHARLSREGRREPALYSILFVKIFSPGT